ncbi:hypothetical protein G6F70_004582 [Rhizopus microsporus]|uniref:Uncharacterized protein n=1 Tax=Rhizopus azygosporus TaxID=86630 RepID=A0A367K145_RHIAZ|nr:hypothetical protein G6F71_004678 [Rhizopus microsporus]RCH95962.1 hypothetical protein CU097_006451 [Rhizopus azygosporus]KAG1199809.1 hypothetical protein G6F70_004582 [Rhizopus microsporus]KAG1214016.1 hypothetical protein G6F69_002307 [Rhizopus microsporus]KAG1233447.1 hypothetical protein G6F67_004273 [Rhizopus microsporus]
MSEKKRSLSFENEDSKRQRRFTLDVAADNQFLLEDYFSLAIVLLDPTKIFIFKDRKDEYIHTLAKHAVKLAHGNLLNTIERMLRLVDSNTSDQELNLLLAKVEDIDKEREYAFITCTIQCLKNKTSRVDDIIRSQLDSRSLLQQVLFHDVRFARLLPLFHVLFNHDSSMVTTSSYENGSSASYKSSSMIGTIANSQSTFSYSSSFDDFISRIPDTNYDEPHDMQEFSIISATMDSDGNIMDDTTTQKESRQEFSVAENEKTTLCYNELILDEIKIGENVLDDSVKANIIQHLKTNKPNVWEKIVNYEPVDIDECYEGLEYKKGLLRAFLDEFGCLNKNKIKLS